MAVSDHDPKAPYLSFSMSCIYLPRLSRGYCECEKWSLLATIQHQCNSANLFPGTRDALHPPWRGVLGNRHPLHPPQRPFCWNTLAAHPVIPPPTLPTNLHLGHQISLPHPTNTGLPPPHLWTSHVQPWRCFVEPFGRRCIKTSLAALQKGPSGSRVLEGDSRVCNPGCLSLPRLPR
ncbi:uncharacterized protein K444DRAFT_259643 [Hyaloscypha bicolor E]|uniref:Uncharacterized protein n=1 Tax=Hyaloscypha bicolor E TaxID=1095630 RepID=A0A2J6SH78_9HELO|nr:uncharacterized protein K444DRAFT_259643 [Hyaloscypha bicolor E]PMD50131.1 hypothetical protein K444DRAFT_259643 [Hyaloscypha bicolor E]